MSFSPSASQTPAYSIPNAPLEDLDDQLLDNTTEELQTISEHSASSTEPKSAFIFLPTRPQPRVDAFKADDLFQLLATSNVYNF